MEPKSGAAAPRTRCKLDLKPDACRTSMHLDVYAAQVVIKVKTLHVRYQAAGISILLRTAHLVLESNMKWG